MTPPHRIRAKPHRLPRAAYQGHVDVAITACVHERQQLFRDAAIVRHFLDVLTTAAAAGNCRVPVYCFMPDHLHLILHGDSPSADAWRVMVQFKQRTGFWLAQYRPTMPWQKDFFDHIIRTPDELSRQAQYIADNPVRKGLVMDWTDYPFTGAIGMDLLAVLSG
jgi:REP element-mobilizing transposase RayT